MKKRFNDFNKSMDDYLFNRKKNGHKENGSFMGLGIRWIHPQKKKNEEHVDEILSEDIDSTRVHIIESDGPWYQRILDKFSRKKESEEEIIEDIENEGEEVKIDYKTGNFIKEDFDEELHEEETAENQTPWWRKAVDFFNPFSETQEINEYDIEVKPEEEEIKETSRIPGIMDNIRSIRKNEFKDVKSKYLMITTLLDELEVEVEKIMITEGCTKKLRKVVLYKPPVDNDIRVFIKMTDKLISQVPNHVMRSFQKSPQYDKYQATISRYK